MGRTIKPVLEPSPSLPEPKKPRASPANFGPHQLFGFDTETTRCGKKELRSSQFAYRTTFGLVVKVIAVKDWFEETVESCRDRLEAMTGETVHMTLDIYESVDEVRLHSQQFYERLVFEGQPRVKRNRKGEMKLTSRKAKRCAVAFNANFDLGTLADFTELMDEMNMGGMEGQGCIYDFRSGYIKETDQEFGMRIKALFLGAKNVPFVQKRGVIWDIQSLAYELWGCSHLSAVGKKVGLRKLVEEGEESLAYAAVDAIITLNAAVELTADLERMGFTGNADRFISGATVSKDLMKQHYTPFYLDQEQHDFAWRAYFGGMTGAQTLEVIREPVSNVIYGDLDGAYNASGQNLEVFKWTGARWVDHEECMRIIREVESDPSTYWKYGSLHLEVEGTFDNVPLRVGTCSKNGTPKKSEGLVWASVDSYRSVLGLGDYLHSRPVEHRVVRGLMATDERSEQPCLFRMTADMRKDYPKRADDGTPIYENWVPNTWFKLAGNCLYGSFANRNGKERETSGKWFNALIASSITTAVRHCMWVVNEASNAYYNDTDSGLTTVEGFHRAVEALRPLDIGFSNKTSDELEGHDVAMIGVVQGSKRYALMAEDGTFGGKCHGLGSWFVFYKGRVRSIAHHEEILEQIWRFNYPHIFGEPRQDILDLPVFHKFSVRTRKIGNMVKEYARRQWDIPLEDIDAYGKAGNFGFLSPTSPNGRGSNPYVMVSYEPQTASELSDFVVQDVAFMWGNSYDKKFDYENLRRWHFSCEDISIAKSYERKTPNTNQQGDAFGVNDRSLGVGL